MKHEESSRQTRLQLADALKKRMARKTLSKITVSELIADCGVNRKTFYYHFEDIYALFKWMLEQEAIEVVKQFDMLLDYREALEFTADYVTENKHLINAAYDAVGREGLNRFFYQDFIGIAEMLIDSIAQQSNVKLHADYRRFLCEFFTEAASSILLTYVSRGDNDQLCREQYLHYIEHLIETALPEAIRSAKDKGLGFVE